MVVKRWGDEQNNTIPTWRVGAMLPQLSYYNPVKTQVLQLTEFLSTVDTLDLLSCLRHWPITYLTWLYCSCSLVANPEAVHVVWLQFMGTVVPPSILARLNREPHVHSGAIYYTYLQLTGQHDWCTRYCNIYILPLAYLWATTTNY